MAHHGKLAGPSKVAMAFIAILRSMDMQVNGCILLKAKKQAARTLRHPQDICDSYCTDLHLLSE